MQIVFKILAWKTDACQLNVLHATYLRYEILIMSSAR